MERKLAGGTGTMPQLTDNSATFKTLRSNLLSVVSAGLVVICGVVPVTAKPNYFPVTSESPKAEALWTSSEVDDEVDDYIDIM